MVQEDRLEQVLEEELPMAVMVLEEEVQLTLVITRILLQRLIIIHLTTLTTVMDIMITMSDHRLDRQELQDLFLNNLLPNNRPTTTVKQVCHFFLTQLVL